MKKINLSALTVGATLLLTTACDNKPATTSDTIAIDSVATDTAMAMNTSDAGGQLNTLTDAEKQAGWKLLFDGQTMDQWRGFHKQPTDSTGWQIADGMLTTMGGSGDFISRDQYGDFEMDFEWKVSAKGNSGVMYRVVEGNNKTTYETGPEYQIIDDANYPGQLTEKQKSGGNYDIEAPSQLASKPVGEFNQSKIIVNDGHVEHWLNGAKVVEYELGSDAWKQQVKASKFDKMKGYGVAEKGHIALQDHGNAVWFRNVKIREL